MSYSAQTEAPGAGYRLKRQSPDQLEIEAAESRKLYRLFLGLMNYLEQGCCDGSLWVLVQSLREGCELLQGPLDLGTECKGTRFLEGRGATS